MRKTLIALFILGAVSTSQPISKQCLDYRNKHIVEHFDKDSDWDGLSTEHRRFIDCLNSKNKYKYLDLLYEIEIKLNPTNNTSTGFVSRKRIQCLYKMKTTNVPTLDEYLNSCVYTRKVRFK